MIKIACNICGSNDYDFLFSGRDRFCRVDNQLFDVVKCRNCGLAYINPQPTQSELKKYYPEDYSPYENNLNTFKLGWFSKTLKKTRDKFRKNNPPLKVNGQTIIKETPINYLDFGCGGGFNLERIKKDHPTWNLYGLDNNDFACAKTRQKGFTVFCGDISEIEIPEGFFDVVNMRQVLEHLNDPKAVLLKINKILKSDGQLIISLPNFNSLAARLFRQYWYDLDVPRHLFFFTPETLAVLLEKTGFSVKKIEYEKELKAEIISLYYLLGRTDLRINPIIWRMLRPIASILHKFKKTSVMVVHAVK